MATKNEWQEYFELMNDRKPTNEEVNAALAAGEIDAEVVVEEVVTPVQPTQPVAEPVQAPVQPTMEAAQPVDAPVAAAPKKSVDTEEIKKKLSGFWGWTKGAVKNPTLADGEEAPKFYGLIALGLSALIFALATTELIYLTLKGSIFKAINPIGRNLMADLKDLSNISSAIPSPANLMFRIFIYMLILGVLIYGAILLAAFISRRYVLQDTSFDITRATDVIGRGMVFAQLAWVLVFLEGFMNILGDKRDIVFSVLVAAILFVPVYAIFVSVNNSKLNHFYAILAAVAAMVVIAGIVLSFGGTAWINNFQSAAEDLGKEINRKLMSSSTSSLGDLGRAIDAIGRDLMK